MTVTSTGIGGRVEEVDVSYTREVGLRLRRIRIERGWSLHDVERRSEGRWKAAVVGSYERGDRNISAARLLALAEFYGVTPDDLLPGEPVSRSSGPRSGVVLDLEALAASGERFERVVRYLETIQIQRGDYNRRVLSIRAEDLRALAVLHEATAEELLDELRQEGVLQGS